MSDIARHGTTTILLSGATYQTSFLNIEKYESINIILNTDVEGTLFVEYSTDATTIDFTKEIIIDSLKINGSFDSFKVISRFARIRYLNGSTNQTTFRLQITLKEIVGKDSKESVSNNQIIGNNNDVNLVRTSNLTKLDIAMGLNNNIEARFVYGTNLNVSTTQEDVWDLGGNYNFLTAATTLEVITNNVNDDIAGTGAQLVFIEGLDVDYNQISEVVVLVGGTPGTSSATSQSFFRVNNVLVISSGTNRGANFNDIDIQASGGGVVVARISGEDNINTSDYGHGISQMAVYTVPKGKIFIIRNLILNVPGSKEVDVITWVVLNPDLATATRYEVFKLVGHSGIFTLGSDFFEHINEKTDVWFSASVVSGSASIDIRFHFYIIDQDPNLV